jgi:hypothetical protein
MNSIHRTIERANPMSIITVLGHALNQELLARGIFTTLAECEEIMQGALERSGDIAAERIKVIEAEVLRRGN